jgi:hypothetical protein
LLLRVNHHDTALDEPLAALSVAHPEVPLDADTQMPSTAFPERQDTDPLMP